jgi:hypothetical protein
MLDLMYFVETSQPEHFLGETFTPSTYTGPPSTLESSIDRMRNGVLHESTNLKYAPLRKQLNLQDGHQNE